MRITARAGIVATALSLLSGSWLTGPALSAGVPPGAATAEAGNATAGRALYSCLAGARTDADRTGPNSGPMALCSINVDGTDRRVVTDKDVTSQAIVSWSPDGSRFAYPDTSWLDQDGGVVVGDADGTGRRVVAAGEYTEVQWSPDGTRLAVIGASTRPERGLWVIDLTDGSRRRLLDRLTSDVSWSPDGSQMSVRVYDTRDPENYITQLAVAPVQGGPVRFLGVEPTSTKTSWSPDGTRLLDGFTVISPTDGRRQTLRTLPPNTFVTAEWSPDASQIAFMTTKDSIETIGVMRADGSQVRNLLQLSNRPFLPPSWSPDGSALIYAHIRQDPDVPTTSIDGDLFRLALDGSAPQQITDGDSAHRPVLNRLVTRAAGPNRTETSVSVSRVSHVRSDTVVVARGDQFSDALAAAPLAAKLQAPLLLTPPDRAPGSLLAEVRRLGASTAYLVGDASAVSAGVEAQLRAAGVSTVRRVAGVTRYDTAAAIARAVGATRVYLASGQDFADAAAVSALAAFLQRPVLLTDKDTVPTATQAAMTELGVTDVTIVGGAAVVSEKVAQQVGQGRTTARLAGSDRYGTSARIADASLAAGMTATRPWLTTGQAFPDALSAGPAAGAAGNVLLLVDPRRLEMSAATRDWLQLRAADRLSVIAVGGPDVVSPAVTVGALQP